MFIATYTFGGFVVIHWFRPASVLGRSVQESGTKTDCLLYTACRVSTVSSVVGHSASVLDDMWSDGKVTTQSATAVCGPVSNGSLNAASCNKPESQGFRSQGICLDGARPCQIAMHYSSRWQRSQSYSDQAKCIWRYTGGAICAFLFLHPVFHSCILYGAASPSLTERHSYTTERPGGHR